MIYTTTTTASTRKMVTNASNEAKLLKDFCREICTNPLTNKLKWYQINTDLELVKICYYDGLTADEYIVAHVLPNVLATEKAYFKSLGASITF